MEMKIKPNFKETVEKFKSSSTQYLINIYEYEAIILSIEAIKLYLSTKFEILMSLNKEFLVLYLYGEVTKMNILHNFLIKHQKLISELESANKLEDLTDVQQNDLNRKLSKLNCQQFLELSRKSKLFLYNILFESHKMFEEHDSDIEIVEIETETEKLAVVNLSPPTEVPIWQEPQTAGDMFNGTAIQDVVAPEESNYRTVIIDGNNVAYGHGGDRFSFNGVKLCVDYFLKLGHPKVYALLPRHRQPLGGAVFEQLEKDDHLKYTPSRKVNNVRETPYDDRFILDAAILTNGVVVSNDQYRDLMTNDKYQNIILNRLIPYTFVGEHIIIPDDPRGLNGPSLRHMLMLSNITEQHNREEPLAAGQTHIEQCKPSTSRRISPAKQQHYHPPQQHQHGHQKPKQTHKKRRPHSQTPVSGVAAKNIPKQSGPNLRGGSSQKQSSSTANTPHKQVQQQHLPPDWSQNQCDIFRQVVQVLPTLEQRIRSIISANPGLKDPNVLVDLVMVSNEH